MSFDIQTKKPKLVEKKLLKLLEDKLKPNEEIKVIEPPKLKWYQKAGSSCLDFLKTNIGLIIIVILLLILLYVRYIEVNKKKKQIKKLKKKIIEYDEDDEYDD